MAFDAPFRSTYIPKYNMEIAQERNRVVYKRALTPAYKNNNKQKVRDNDNNK